jgi:hypothetical protein
MTLTSGDRTNGTWQGTLTISSGLSSCSIPLVNVALCDRVDNCQSGSPETWGIEAATITLTNNAASDSTAPSLASVSVLPSSVDITYADASVTVTLAATDNLTGVIAGTVTYSSAACGGGDLSLSWNDNTGSTGMTLTSGDRTNGTWQGTLTISSGLSSCSIPLVNVALCDQVDNCQSGSPETWGIEAATITVTRSD